MRAKTFARRFLPIWALGLLGIASLVLHQPSPELLDAAPELRALPPLAQRAVLLINPLVIMTIAAAIGAALSHRVGLRSAVAGDRDAQWAMRTALLSGGALALLLAGVDWAVADVLGAQWQAAMAKHAAAPWAVQLAIGVFYGGLAEEIIMRWGLMSLLLWVAWRMQRRPAGAGLQPSFAAAWLAVGVSALAFAAAHLPALAQSVDLSAAVVLRTLALNGVAGLVYGWLCLRRSLESAMLAHAATHVGLALLRGISGVT